MLAININRKWIVLVVGIFVSTFSSGCSNEKINHQLFMAKHPEWSIFLNNKEISKYSDIDFYTSRNTGAFLTIKNKDRIILNNFFLENEYSTAGAWTDIDSIGYEVRYRSISGCLCTRLEFIELEKTKEKEIIKEQITKNKGGDNMSFFQIFLMILISLIMVKVGHFITLKFIFRYAKSGVEHIKKEWKECDKE